MDTRAADAASDAGCADLGDDICDAVPLAEPAAASAPPGMRRPNGRTRREGDPDPAVEAETPTATERGGCESGEAAVLADAAVAASGGRLDPSAAAGPIAGCAGWRPIARAAPSWPPERAQPGLQASGESANDDDGEAEPARSSLASEAGAGRRRGWAALLATAELSTGLRARTPPLPRRWDRGRKPPTVGVEAADRPALVRLPVTRVPAALRVCVSIPDAKEVPAAGSGVPAAGQSLRGPAPLFSRQPVAGSAPRSRAARGSTPEVSGLCLLRPDPLPGRSPLLLLLLLLLLLPLPPSACSPSDVPRRAPS